MSHKNNCAPGTSDLTHFPETFALEFDVTHGENLIDEKDLRFEVSGNCKGQTHIHTTRVMFDRGIHKLLQFSEGDNLIEFACDFLFAHAENRAT